jgi:hypothetical protein
MAEQGGIRLQRLVVRWRANRDVCVAIVRTRRLIDHRCQSHADDSQSVYWSEQTSMRTRVLLMIDWIKRGIFGRDLSKVSIRLSPCLQHVIVTASIPLLHLGESRVSRPRDGCPGHSLFDLGPGLDPTHLPWNKYISGSGDDRPWR